MDFQFACCRCSDSEEQRKMESRAKNKLTNKDNNNKTRLRELRLSLQLSPCCALPVSLPAPAEHLGEGGERYGGWGLKLVLVIQNFATLRSHFFVFFLSMLRSNLANLLTLRIFFQTVLYLKMKKPPRGPMTHWILGRATNWFWSLKNHTILLAFTYLSGYIVWSGVRRCNGVQVGIILFWFLFTKEMVVVVVCSHLLIQPNT